jgi:PASTA domain
MRRLCGKLIPTTVIASIALLALAGYAQAQTVILGPGLGELEGTATCSTVGGCGAVTTVPAISSQTAVSPVDGTVVQWALLGASETPGFVLDVMRHNLDGSWTVTASSSAVTPLPGMQTFTTALPIKAGEYVGGVTPDGGSTGVLKANLATIAVFGPALSVGQPGIALAEVETGSPAFQAVVETPPVLPPPTTQSTGATSTGSPAAQASAPAEPHCVVPKLNGKKLKASKKTIKAALCNVGLVSTKNGVKAASGKVIGQSPKAGKVVAAHSPVSLKLA